MEKFLESNDAEEMSYSSYQLGTVAIHVGEESRSIAGHEIKFSRLRVNNFSFEKLISLSISLGNSKYLFQDVEIT